MPSKKLLSSESATFLTVFTASQSVLGCIANGIVLLYFLLARRSLNTTADKLVLNLSIADFVSLATYVPWRSYLLYVQTVTKNSKIYTSLFVMCVFCTENAVLLIGFDRLIAAVFPLRYNAIISCNVLWIAVISSWFSAILLAIGHGLSLEYGFHREYELFLCALSCLELIILSVIYAILLRIVRNQKRGLSRRTLQSLASKQEYSLKKTIRITFAIVCFFYIAYIPSVLYRVISTVDTSLSKHEKVITWRWLTAFTFLNSCFDPVLYFFGMKKYRNAFGQRILPSERNRTTIQSEFSQSRKTGNAYRNRPRISFKLDATKSEAL